VAEVDLPLTGSTATATYQHTDALGTPVAITNSSKTVTERRDYEPYGYQITPALKDGPNYTGHVADAATGMIYMQQRYYDPLVGAFPSADPVTPESPGGAFNRYWYANGNPFAFSDPDGRQSTRVHEDDTEEERRAALEERERRRQASCSESQSCSSERYGNTNRSPQMFTVGNAAAYVAGFYGVDETQVGFTDSEYADCAQTMLCSVRFNSATASAYLAFPLTGMPPAAGRGGGSSRMFGRLFGKGGLINSGRYLRVGIGREGGQSVFRVAGESLSRVPKPVRDLLGFKEIAPGVFKWDLWTRGGL
jgi:RHS repeat-associated protein